MIVCTLFFLTILTILLIIICSAQRYNSIHAVAHSHSLFIHCVLFMYLFPYRCWIYKNVLLVTTLYVLLHAYTSCIQYSMTHVTSVLLVVSQDVDSFTYIQNINQI